MNVPLQFDLFTLFPEVCLPHLQTSILLRAQERGLVEVRLHNIRDWTTDLHHVTDDEPYGGGGGMVMKPEPIFAALEGVLGNNFVYTLSDGNGGTDTATVTVTVTAVNDPPTAVDDTVSVNEDSTANQINVRTNDFDVDGDTINITAATQPSHGSITFTTPLSITHLHPIIMA